MGKAIIFLIILTLVIPIVYAPRFDWFVNPSTAKPDRSLSLNQTGYSIITTNLTILGDLNATLYDPTLWNYANNQSGRESAYMGLENVSNNTLTKDDNITTSLWNIITSNQISPVSADRLTIGTTILNSTKTIILQGGIWLKGSNITVGSEPNSTLPLRIGNTYAKDLDIRFLLTDSNSNALHGAFGAWRAGAAPNFFGIRTSGTFDAPVFTPANTDVFVIIGVTGDGSGNYSQIGSINIKTDTIGGTSNGSTPGQIDFRTTPNGTSSLVTRMSIKHDGKIGINTTTPTHAFTVQGGSNFSDAVFMSKLTGASGSPDALCHSTTTGEVLDNPTTTCLVSSKRFKENITPIRLNSCEILDKLQAKEFNYISGGRHFIYFIAEDVEKIEPKLIAYDNEGRPHSIHNEEITALTIDCMQKMRKEINELKLKIK